VLSFALCNSFATACLVASVHRMSLLHHFSKVVLMANGRVQDVGTVDELLARQPAFREMLGRPDAVPASTPVPEIDPHAQAANRASIGADAASTAKAALA
jgi:ATP-binding cassette subfamily B protein